MGYFADYFGGYFDAAAAPAVADNAATGGAPRRKKFKPYAWLPPGTELGVALVEPTRQSHDTFLMLYSKA